MKIFARFFCILIMVWPQVRLHAQSGPVRPEWAAVPPPFEAYFEKRVAQLSGAEWMEAVTAADWPEQQAEMRQQLQEMLGLSPWPERTPLNPVPAGKVQGAGYVVEKFSFEPLPGLHIGANLYVPVSRKGPLPGILYMCGHSNVMDGNVRIGNKAGYQHHGAWFAENGYVCLIPDTIQWGEIPGEHHGTYRLDRWWWASRGYTPAGVEAWIGIRALDYLESRPEVDAARMGMTGRSGGGAYTWWVGALDDRIRAAVPVAGITTLHDHVVNGVVEGHCDCMYMINTRQWDFDRVAALMAPRPLLISNTDSDDIFPLAGVVRIFDHTRRIYRKLGVEEKAGLHITTGPHVDSQALNYGAFEWFNRHLKQAEPGELIHKPAQPRHETRELKVFGSIPSDENVTRVDEFFVPIFTPPSPPTADGWSGQRDQWMAALKAEVFAAWPAPAAPDFQVQEEKTVAGRRMSMLKITTQEGIDLPLWIFQDSGVKPEPLSAVVLHILDDGEWANFRVWSEMGFPPDVPGNPFSRLAGKATSGEAVAFFFPRGAGPTSIEGLPKSKNGHLRRRFMLIGETMESGQVFDICQAVHAVRKNLERSDLPVSLRASRHMAANVIYAALRLENVRELRLEDLPPSHRTGPTYLNVLKHLDLPQALAMAVEKARVKLTLSTSDSDAAAWDYPVAVSKVMGWENRLTIHRP